MTCRDTSGVKTDRLSPARLKAGVILGLCCGLLGTAAWLEPSTEGLGTHRQLGLTGCAWLANNGSVCPTCGMTTAFALAADGRVLEAAKAQPAGAALALLSAMGAWVSGWVLLKGDGVLAYLRVWWRPGWWALGLAALLMGAWVYKLTITGA